MKATFRMQIDQLEETLLNIEASLQNVDEKLKFKIMLIGEELLTNLVRHADFQSREPLIAFDIETSKDGSYTLECRDNAKAFNPLERQDPNVDADIENRELGGLGIFLTKQYADRLEYAYRDACNILRISL